jgi:carbamoyltransferase
MRILGIHGGRKREGDDDPSGHMFHDSAAVLLVDGELVAAVEEERLSRIKHTNCFPVRAVEWCLRQGGIRLDEVDRIPINISRYVADGMEKAAFLENPRYTEEPDGLASLARLFRAAFGVDVTEKIRFCNHHIAHAWSAYAPSGFERSLIFSVDGDGDNCSGMVLRADGRKLSKLREYSIRQSLGRLYHTLIRVVGYRRFDEYKVMGLAPYGDPDRFSKVFSRCYRLLPEGDYLLEEGATWFACLDEAGILRQSRRKGEPFSQVHMDFSASLQACLEKIVFHVLQHYQSVTGERNLCLAGGVAHNCTLNGKIANSGLFDKVFVQPAAHDAGGAMGAAFWVHFSDQKGASPPKMRHLSLGPDLGKPVEVARELRRWSEFVTIETVSDPAVRAAQLLASGHVIGWAQGRSEFGPRALGNRSILADPRPGDNKLRVNQMVKKRESYRPFAPSVLEEKVRDYFELPPGDDAYPFMIFVFDVRPQVRELLGAITHVDGTARVQTVSRDVDPLYWRLIDEFGRLTGVPMVLNTSFNNNAEPIVDSVDDAVACFLTTGLEYLVVGNHVVAKKDAAVRRRACLSAVPSLLPFRKLVKRKLTGAEPGGSTPAFAIETTKSRDFVTASIAISPAMFAALQNADDRKTMAELLEEAGVVGHTVIDPVLVELESLWAERAVALAPPRSDAQVASKAPGMVAFQSLSA